MSNSFYKNVFVNNFLSISSILNVKTEIYTCDSISRPVTTTEKLKLDKRNASSPDPRSSTEALTKSEESHRSHPPYDLFHLVPSDEKINFAWKAIVKSNHIMKHR